MKELSIEEKAKAYDEALKQIKECTPDENGFITIYPQEIFPELKESEDERMIQYFKDLAPFDKAEELYEKYGFSHKDAIAWLEKQGEQKPVPDWMPKFLDELRSKKNYFDWDEHKDIEGGILAIINWMNPNYFNEKDGKQKADKVEPKFREGDWVVYCNEDVDLITGIEENGYCINNSGYIPFICASDVRLWTIEDAKDGDVLVSESNCGLGTWYCIFKSLDDDESMTVYCYLARDGRFETKKELCFDKDPFNTKPATKEQRDLLFQKMYEAGYEWDAEKKELKEIEQNPAWSEEDERKSLEIKCLIGNYRTGNDEYELCSWIDKLKNRVQPKQEWSEGDKAVLDALIRKLEGEDIYVSPYLAVECLKSLRPQSHWKPSEEQINALNYVVNLMASSERPTENDLYYNILKSLRQQLKKLKA